MTYQCEPIMMLTLVDGGKGAAAGGPERAAGGVGLQGYAGGSEPAARGPAAEPDAGPAPAAVGARHWGQGLSVVHFSPQPEPLLVTEATARVHFSAQPETFTPIRPPNKAHQNCSRQAKKWRGVTYTKR